MGTRNFTPSDGFDLIYLDDSEWEELALFDYVNEIRAAVEEFANSLEFHSMQFIGGYYWGYQAFIEIEEDPRQFANDESLYYFNRSKKHARRDFYKERYKIRFFLESLRKNYCISVCKGYNLSTYWAA